ncbi:GYD domain-containing protein [Streptomyces thermoalcalitolerans]|uniref:GYD domain-containing protein n=2 Tax=Streptomyces thermoalcalitolerans TaxID=65605 RepID=A0ABP4A693_9ACTN
MCPLTEAKAMPTYVTLLNWTEQGIRNYKDTTERAEAFASAAQRLGANVLNLYWTVGPYDLVAVVEAPDEETATAVLLRLGGVGNVRTTTLRAFGREEMSRIVAKAAG